VVVVLAAGGGRNYPGFGRCDSRRGTARLFQFQAALVRLGVPISGDTKAGAVPDFCTGARGWSRSGITAATKRRSVASHKAGDGDVQLSVA
jgi:hypothetical protein